MSKVKSQKNEPANISSFFMVAAVEKQHKATFLSVEQDIPLVWADGMVGVIPVFKDRDSAELYADNHFAVLELKVITNEEKKGTIL